MNPKHSICVIYTGGTFGMAPANSELQNALRPQPWQHVLKHIAAFEPGGYFEKNHNVEICLRQFDPPIDSSDISIDHWIALAQIIELEYDKYEGFVVIHGTDTLAYSASALSFLLENLDKPIVFTGAQLPVAHPRTDAIVNLSNAIYIAAYKAFNLPCIPEVLVCFNDKLLRGNRSTKASTFDFEGFESPNFTPLAELEESIKVHTGLLLPPTNKPLKVYSKLSNNIVDLSLFPGFQLKNLALLLEQESTKGVIFQTYGAGNAPSSPAFLDLLKKATLQGKLILNITQCFRGGVLPGKYETGEKLHECGLINGGNLTHEAALTKMMFVLDNIPENQRRTALESNLKGEL